MALCGFAIGTSLISLQSETFKATGHPRFLVRVHTVSAVAATIGVFALLPFDLVGITGGVSIGLMVGAGYGMVKAVEIAGVPGADAWREMWPPFAASLVMAAVGVFLEFELLHAADKPTVEALALIALEAVVAAVVYLGALRVLAPATLREGLHLAKNIRRRRSGSVSPEPGVGASAPGEQESPGPGPAGEDRGGS
jgi:O-antigen/teichoic acid export membrane protein